MPVPTPRPTTDRIERELDRMTNRLATDLRGARGDARKEEAALRAALAAYGAARARMGLPAAEGAVKFFAVDGIGYQKARTPALAAARGSASDAGRWLTALRRLVDRDRVTPRQAAAPASKRTGKPAGKPAASKGITKAKPKAKTSRRSP